MGKLEGKIALVTGGTSGIGLATESFERGERVTASMATPKTLVGTYSIDLKRIGIGPHIKRLSELG